MEKFLINVTCSLGIEGILANEMRALEFEDITVSDGNVSFFGGIRDMIRANLYLRCAGKVLIVLGRFKAYTFDELFENVKKLPFEKWIGKTDAFPVALGHSVKSKLFSTRDCQSIIKKAAAERLKEVYKVSYCEETGAEYKIRFMILNDTVSVYIDTSGPSLHKRGYRQKSNQAPIKETLAAALVYISRYKGRDLFLDPMCGSGTIAIEAAMLAKDMAPGLNRRFAFEAWSNVPKKMIKDERDAARSKINDKELKIKCFDIDEECVKLTKENAEKAGVGKYIQVERLDINNLTKKNLDDYEKGVCLVNPPYGERLLDTESVMKLYESMGKVLFALDNFQFYIISADETFEKYFNHKADKNRKVYNGMIRCYIYQYFTHNTKKDIKK